MTVPSSGPVSVRLLQPFSRLLVARKVSLLGLIDGLGMKPELFLDPDARISWEKTLALLERALAVTGDEALGVHAAEFIHPGDFDAVELVARASGTRRSALTAVSRYAGLMRDGASLTRSVEGEFEAWTLNIPPPAPLVPISFTLGIFVVVGRSLSDGNVSPDWIEMAFPVPSAPAVYERIYGCPVRWGAKRNALIVATARLDRKIAHITPSLAHAMEQHAEKLLAALPKASTQSNRVREQIVAALREGPVAPDDVCRRLKISKRTLRRRLQDEGRSFSDLLSEVRRELAQQYLEDPSRPITEVAFLLGFSDTSAFQRAFRRWFGMAPSEHRRGQRAVQGR